MDPFMGSELQICKMEKFCTRDDLYGKILFKNFWVYVHISLIHFTVHLKPTQYCKSIIFQINKEIKTFFFLSSFGEFLGGLVVRTLCFHCRRHRFEPWSGN